MTATASQLRALLAEKFPGLKTRLPDPAGAAENLWPVNLAAVDKSWPAGLARGALTEIISANPNDGSARLIHALLRHAAGENQIVALVDGADSLDVCELEESVLARLLWVRCRSAAEATRAADLILRDRNFTLVLLDLKLNPEAQLRKIPATLWHRWQRLIENTATVCGVVTPRPLVSSSRRRVVLHGRLRLTLDVGGAPPPAPAPLRG